jgi:hypothetical protein
MRRITILVFLTLLVVFYAGNDALASFRCGPNLVRVGQTTVRVLIECGPPTYKEVTRIETTRDYRSIYPYESPFDEVTQVVETWYYNCGPNRFIKILTFRGGILRSVSTGRYGSGESDCIGAERRKKREELRSQSGGKQDPSSEDLDRGRISIYGFPHFADVYLDGKYVGDTPCTLDDIEPGRYVLTVAKEGYRDLERQVMVKPGETLHLEVYLDLRR